MSLNTKRLLFVFISWFSVAIVGAQTLYWVGGSGNFNDPSHWSLTSGGVSANILPNSSNDVVFDDNSSLQDYFIVGINSNIQTKSFITQIDKKALVFNGNSGSVIHIGGSFNLSRKIRLNTSADIIFESLSPNKINIDIGEFELNNNLIFKSGNYFFNSLKVTETKTIRFGGGNYSFAHALITAGNIINEDASAHFDIKDSYFKSAKKFNIAASSDVKAEGVYIMADLSSNQNYNVPISLSASKGYTSVNTINVVCPVTISLTPACSGSCTGVITVSLSPSCTNTPYRVSVSNPICPAFAAAMGTNSIAGSVYTYTNACICLGFNYNIAVFDASNNLQTGISGNFTPNNASLFPNNIEPLCNYSCDGTLAGGIFPNGPFSVTVTATGTTITTFTTAFGYSIPNRCAGTYSFNITDAGGCSNTVVDILGAPAPVVATAVTTTIDCKGANNGALSITPSGGANTVTPSYTVTFSNSAVFTSTGNPVAVTGLGVGPISATVTDLNGCVASTSTVITEPSATLSVAMSQTNLACNNVCIGALSATASGGTGPYTYSWSASGSTLSSRTSLCASVGMETLTVSDANGCSNSSQTFSITQPPAITLTPTQTNVVCSGASTGAASITPSGGTGTFHYTWTAPGPPALTGDVPSQTNLLSFSSAYTVNVLDGNNCTSPSVFITITQPPAVTLAITNKSVSCFGLSDGGATVTASGGNNSSYTYSWTPGAFTSSAVSTFSNGIYSLTVKDASACPTSTTINIIQPSSGLSVAISSSSLTCNVLNALPCDGTINAVPSGGVPAYNYTVTGPASYSNTGSPPFTGICPGNYTVFAKDASGCSIVPSTITVIEPPALTAGINITSPIACAGTSVAGLTGSGAGGTPTYALTWTTPSGPNAGNILTNQPAGSYILLVTDSKGCTKQAVTTVTAPASLTVAVNTSSISCYSVCNGVLSSTVSGGTGSYNYVWTNSLSATVGTNATATSLCPEIYTLTVTDANLCAKTSTGQVFSPPPIVLTKSVSNVSCFGGSDGSATVTATGGTPPFNTYNFVSSSSTITNNNGVIGGQSTASFVVTVTDNSLCVQTTTLLIGTPAALAAGISSVGSCNVCNGSAAVTPSFGTAPYTYLWTSSLSGTFATTQTVGGLCPATYTALITDFKNCTITKTVAISQIVNFTVSASPTSIFCNGLSTGSAVVNNIVGGNPGYTYSWTPSGQTTATLTGVLSGTYQVLVVDSSTPACSNTATIAITQPPAISINSSTTHVTCFGYSNGALSTTVSGGVVGGYTYSWSPGNQTTSAISSQIAGTYTLLVKDVNLCPKTTTFQINQSPSITILYTATNPSACTNPDGVICTTVTGGSGSGYTNAWSNGPSTGSCISSLPGGNYQYTVTDGAGCSNSVTINLFNATGPTLTAVSSAVNCFGASTGAATVTAVGSGTFAFVVSPVAPTSTIASGVVATGLSSGTYAFNCTDINGCVTSTSIPITQSPSVTLNPSVTPTRCNGICTGSITVAPTQGSLPSPTFVYNWVSLTPPITGQGTKTVAALCANPYTLNLTDALNCPTQYTFAITQPSPIVISPVATSNVKCNNACTGSIVVGATGGIGALGYSWTPIGGNTQTVTNLCATSATVYTVTVTDAQSCSTTATFPILQPPALTGTVTALNATCSNSCNATATLNAAGGVPGYIYSWSSSTNTLSTENSLCAATQYTASVTDANGCVLLKPFTTNAVAPLSATLIPTNPKCNAACDGSISTQVSGAQGSLTYSWSPAGAGQNPTLLCATPNPNYTVVISDQNSCSLTAVTTLTNPLLMQATIFTTQPTCFGQANGDASVTVTNNAGPLQYTWQPTGPPTKTTQAVTGLPGGIIYTLTVRDNNLCKITQTFSLSSPSSMTVNNAISPASCSQSNGAVFLSPTGGVPGYTYVWPGGISTSFSASGIPAGVYSITVSDSHSCTTTVSIILPNSSGPTYMPIVSSSITCNSQCTGAASVAVTTVTGGTQPYTATWLSPAPSGTNEITGLCAGVYNAQITDATGCLGFTTVTIAEPSPISNTTNIGFPLCPGICDGNISVSSSGGNAPYTYTWMPMFSNGTSITNLCAGDYTLVVGYNNVCTDTSRINLPVQTVIAIAPTVTNNICFGTSTAKASVSVSGGSSPYVAGWSNGQNGLNINNLVNGTYTVVVTDINGCSNTETTSITSGAQITSTTSIFSPACGLCSGAATVAATGTGPFNFSWSNSATSPTVANLCAGVYQVIISDVLSCTKTETIIVNNSNGIDSARVNTKQISCSGSCIGGASVTAFGGTAPITYNWLSPATSGSVISNLCSGTYFVQMVDAAGCIRTTSATINPLVTLSVSPFVYQPACGASDGSISIAIAGGTPTYNIVWNPPAGLTTSLTNLNSGVYSYTVTESGINACSISNTINVSNNNGPIIVADQTNINCFGQCTGLISTTVTSANPPLTYSWSSGSAITSSVVTNLCKGVVTLTVSDGIPCNTIQSFTITDNPLLQLSKENVKNANCFGDCSGEIKLVPSGGSLPYTYTWTNTNATFNPIDSLCDGVYVATITDSKGCALTSPSYTIKSASSISLAVNSTKASCGSVSDASISVNTTGGLGTYTYTWKGPSNYAASSQNVSNIFSGNYSLSVLDSLGCKKDTAISISPSITIMANAGPDQIICPETGSVVLNATGSSNSTYKWFSLTDTTNALAVGPQLFVSNIKKARSFVLKSISPVAACYAKDTVMVNVHILSALDAGRDITVPVHSSVTIGGYPTNWGALTLTWSPAQYLNDPNSSNPITSNTVNTTFIVTASDMNGCITTDSVHVFLYPELNITSGFTPNGDGKNDLWIIDYIDQFPETTVEIFNRWGDVIFSAKNGYNEPFNGKYKGTDLPVGTYYYIINLNHPGYPKPFTGPLTIFR
ncbi:gliding motility-associated C-terminal domain-containing protein [Aurantibacillus circumpalustris]|uniref:T9SS type B sorting domain-containing protein n=1 Tax=Aurantibacillus circumpalustris TaxID=3036359 RepID=UPI00295B9CA7|nr:gliding motility-associated C-terminal domain-containing protein [Aurantibacillus circumpalustris]